MHLYFNSRKTGNNFFFALDEKNFFLNWCVVFFWFVEFLWGLGRYWIYFWIEKLKVGFILEGWIIFLGDLVFYLHSNYCFSIRQKYFWIYWYKFETKSVIIWRETICFIFFWGCEKFIAHFEKFKICQKLNYKTKILISDSKFQTLEISITNLSLLKFLFQQLRQKMYK